MKALRTVVILAAMAVAAYAKTAAPAVPPAYFGAVEVGSKGTKAALYSFAREGEGRDARILYGRTINTKLVSSMKDKRFVEDGIQDAVSAVQTLLGEMKAEAARKKLTAEYYVVGSSGAARAENRDELAAAINKATGLDMDFIDSKREGFFGLLSAVPYARRSTSMFIDIGGGNSSLGCLVGDSELNNFKATEIKFGSVSGRNEGAKRNAADTVAGIEQVMHDDVGPAYAKESMDTPCLRNRQRIYWVGGAAWATATFTHPEKALAPYVQISRADVNRFLTSLKNGSWNQKRAVYVFPKDMPEGQQAAIRARAEKDREDVQNVFVREDLISGVSIMKTVADAANQSGVLVFARHGNFLYGYALDRYRVDRAKPAVLAKK